MPPRILPLHSIRKLCFQTKSLNAYVDRFPLGARVVPQRTITANEKPLPKAEPSNPGPDQEQLPHVSEEAAAIGRITGEGGPDLEQGTPIEEVLERDTNDKNNAPKVLQGTSAPTVPKGTRLYSTSVRRWQEALVQYEDEPLEVPGNKFGLPSLPLDKQDHLKHRYEPIVQQVTNLMMKDGKLSKAQRNMSMILNYLRTASPPRVNPEKPLLPDAPPPSHLPLNPVLYLTLAIDSVAPLLRIRSQKGAAGGGVALQIPVPLGLKQRRRQAVMWILTAAGNKSSKGSGRGMFAQKFAEEIIAIVEGKSAIWDRRGGVHKIAVNARANLAKAMRRF